MLRSRAIGFAAAGALVVGCARPAPRDPAPTPAVAHPGSTVTGAARDEIAAMMQRSAAAWNRGDLDAFVSDYATGPGTTYIGRRGIVRGPAAIREVYAPRFAPGGVRDSLSFEELEVDVLAPGVVNAVAYYRLSRGDSTIARGPTSLVMRRLGGQWKIVHDHSS